MKTNSKHKIIIGESTLLKTKEYNSKEGLSLKFLHKTIESFFAERVQNSNINKVRKILYKFLNI